MHLNVPRQARETRMLFAKADEHGWFEGRRERHWCIYKAQRMLSASYLRHTRRLDRVLAHGTVAVLSFALAGGAPTTTG